MGTLVGGRILNSLVLVVLAGVIGTLIGVGLGVLAAARRDSVFDHVLSVIALAVTALPEFVVAVVLVIFFAAVVVHWFPAVSVFVPGTAPWSNPKELVLPVATLVIVIVPYVFRMMRASMIDALESDYVQMAQLKGVPKWRVLLVPRAAERHRADHPGDRAELPVPGRRRGGRGVHVQLPGARPSPGGGGL